MSKVAVVCWQDAAGGFRLAGVETIGIQSITVARLTLLDHLEGDEYALLVVDQALVDELPPRTQNKLFASNRPVVVTLDLSLTRRADVQDSRQVVQEMVRKAVGYHVNIG